MKKGFTLVEVLAVVALIALIGLLAAPTIINQINNKKSELSDVALSMLGSAAELYIDKYQNIYPRTIGNTYCIKLKTLVDEGFLTEPIKDLKTNKEIEVLTKVGDHYEAKTKIKLVVSGPVDLNYSLINENNGESCTEVRH